MTEKILIMFKRKKGLFLLLLGIAAGLCLLIIDQQAVKQEGEELNTHQTDTYIADLEQRLENIISAINGVTDPRVLITLETSAEVFYASDDSVDSEKHVVVNDSLVPVKERLPTVKGVAVVCKGGDKPETKRKIIEMTSSLLGIPSNRIYVSE